LLIIKIGNGRKWLLTSNFIYDLFTDLPIAQKNTLIAIKNFSVVYFTIQSLSQTVLSCIEFNGRTIYKQWAGNGYGKKRYWPNQDASRYLLAGPEEPRITSTRIASYLIDMSHLEHCRTLTCSIFWCTFYEILPNVTNETMGTIIAQASPNLSEM
jgi:hypothetical protein